MSILSLDAFFLFVVWIAGITVDLTGPYIHLLPLLACAAVLLRWYSDAAAAKEAVKE